MPKFTGLARSLSEEDVERNNSLSEGIGLMGFFAWVVALAKCKGFDASEQLGVAFGSPFILIFLYIGLHKVLQGDSQKVFVVWYILFFAFLFLVLG